MDPESSRSNSLTVIDDNSPIPPVSLGFLQALGTISNTAVDHALLSYALVYSSTQGKIILREDQLLAAVHFHEGRDVVKVARTGSGKTMQIVIAALMNPRHIILVLSPLTKLQDSMVAELNSDFAGINAIAINHELRHDTATWKAIEQGAYNIIITSPEQCKTIEGHSTPLHDLLLKNKPWSHSIAGTVCDEAHMITLWGLALGNQEAFRPAYGQLWDLRVALRDGTPMLCLSATAPSHVLDSLRDSLGLDNPVVLKSSINRANQVYAAYPIFGGLKDFRNLRMLINKGTTVTLDGQTRTLSTEEYISQTPKMIIFVDDADLMVDAHVALYNFTPLSLRSELFKLGFIRFYHAGMSRSYLNETYLSFAENDNQHCRILFATSAFSLGINISDIQYVIQYGLCQTVEDLLQRFGRNSRRNDIQGLSLLMYDAWAVQPSAKPTKREKRTSDAMKCYAQSNTCLREYLASYADDDSPEALDFTGPHCCSYHTHRVDSDFDLQSYFPAVLHVAPPPSKTTRKRPAGKKNVYRPKFQRAHMTKMLEDWRESYVLNGKIPEGMPVCFVLTNTAITTLARIPYEQIKISAALLTSSLHQTAAWSALFADDLLAAIRGFEHTVEVEKSTWEAAYKAARPPRKKAIKAKLAGVGKVAVKAGHSGGSNSDKESDDSEDDVMDIEQEPPEQPALKRLRLGPGLSLLLPVYD